jgi:hypothetical protein
VKFDTACIMTEEGENRSVTLISGAEDEKDDAFGAATFQRGQA